MCLSVCLPFVVLPCRRLAGDVFSTRPRSSALQKYHRLGIRQDDRVQTVCWSDHDVERPEGFMMDCIVSNHQSKPLTHGRYTYTTHFNINAENDSALLSPAARNDTISNLFSSAARSFRCSSASKTSTLLTERGNILVTLCKEVPSSTEQ